MPIGHFSCLKIDHISPWEPTRAKAAAPICWSFYCPVPCVDYYFVCQQFVFFLNPDKYEPREVQSEIIDPSIRFSFAVQPEQVIGLYVIFALRIRVISRPFPLAVLQQPKYQDHDGDASRNR